MINNVEISIFLSCVFYVQMWNDDEWVLHVIIREKKKKNEWKTLSINEKNFPAVKRGEGKVYIFELFFLVKNLSKNVLTEKCVYFIFLASCIIYEKLWRQRGRQAGREMWIKFQNKNELI